MEIISFIIEKIDWLILGVFLLGLITLIYFFKTKTEGFGIFTVSTLLLILVIFLSSLFYLNGQLDERVMTNILFTISGFAIGLITKKD
ncbi:hypothetical protein L5F07_07425 [Aliarcobacter butzleri]|uniref:hypothetical protein n=1 Tax=Aliarcobacter butzleri TaxID=28197 RepID=UPI001EDB3087|nr:hypothetical protein [Aliarcobacter butzleri]MCG3679084.1 hypothetical protein [Aliarcobacter butzleri]